MVPLIAFLLLLFIGMEASLVSDRDRYYRATERDEEEDEKEEESGASSRDASSDSDAPLTSLAPKETMTVMVRKMAAHEGRAIGTKDKADKAEFRLHLARGDALALWTIRPIFGLPATTHQVPPRPDKSGLL